MFFGMQAANSCCQFKVDYTYFTNTGYDNTSILSADW